MLSQLQSLTGMIILLPESFGAMPKPKAIRFRSLGHVDTFKVVVGIVLIWGAVFWLIRLARFAKEGEIFLVMSAGGDGLVGQVLRSERPVLFWTVWTANLALIIGLDAFSAFVVLG